MESQYFSHIYSAEVPLCTSPLVSLLAVGVSVHQVTSSGYKVVESFLYQTVHCESIAMPGKNNPQILPRTSSAIPSRTSRKRVAEEDKENEPECSGLFNSKDVQETAELEKSLAQSRKKLKAKGSFGVDFWSQTKVITETEMRWNTLKRKQSMSDFVAQGGKESSWKDKQQARILREEQRSLDLRLRCIKNQMDRPSAPVDSGTTRITRRWFMELLNAAPVFKGGIAAGNTST